MGNVILGFRSYFKQIGIASLLGAWILTGCSRPPSSSEILGPSDDETKAHRHGEFEKDQARFKANLNDSAAGIDVLRYDVKAEFDWTNHRLNALTTITFRLVNTSLTELDLESRAKKIHSVTLKDKKLVPFTHESDRLKISLQQFSREERTAPLTVYINYEARANVVGEGDPSSLTSVPHRESDPVKSRVAFTTSEPVGASDWLPCHNIPSDRAFFSIEVEMEPQERLIANGALVEEYIAKNKRVMRYQTKYTIPTYLMAFAVGEFEMISEREGALPVSIWHRKGLPGAYREVVGQLRGMIRHYESLMGPYPFEKYALVLLPEFPSGGIENASITFQAENRSSESRLSSDFGLSAHELGHQWFGDYVTVDTWDDLWIKEGMATLLSEEATRDFEDRNRSGRLFGQNYWTTEGDAIRDQSLKPDDKYTTGPYDRAGWLLTQIRSAAGEEAFWKAIRTVLRKNAFGSIGTEEFLTYFGPYLSRNTYQKLLRAVAAKKLPRIELTREEDGIKTFLLTDPDGAMIVPLTVRWYDDSGNFTEMEWEAGKTLSIAEDEARLLVLDPKDAQAINAFVVEKGFFDTHFGPYLIPRTERQIQLLGSLSGSAQNQALQSKKGWDLKAAAGKSLYDALSSDTGKFLALQRFCEIAGKRNSVEDVTWSQLIRGVLRSPAWLGVPRWSSSQGLVQCLNVVPDVYQNDWDTLTSASKVPRPSLLHLYTFFPQAPKESFAMWKNVFAKNDSVRTQLIALTGIARHGYKGTKFEADNELKKEIRNYLMEVFRNEDGSEVQNALLGLSFLMDKSAAKDIADLITRTRRISVQTRAICVAFSALEKNPEHWESFLTLVGDTKSLPPKVQRTLKNPMSGCP